MSADQPSGAEPESSGENSAGEYKYRQHEKGDNLKLERSYLEHPAEPVIRHIRQYLTFIEGEAQVGDNETARKYFAELEPWVYQLKQRLSPDAS